MKRLRAPNMVAMVDGEWGLSTREFGCFILYVYANWCSIRRNLGGQNCPIRNF